MDPVAEVVQATQACSLDDPEFIHVGYSVLTPSEQAVLTEMRRVGLQMEADRVQADQQRRSEVAHELMDLYQRQGSVFIYYKNVNAYDLEWFVHDQRSKGVHVEYEFGWGPGKGGVGGVRIEMTTTAGDRAANASAPSSKTDCACENPASS